MYLCQQLQLEWAIGSLAHVPGTVFVHPFKRPKVFVFKKTVENLLTVQVLVFMLTADIVDHQRSCLLLTMLHVYIL